MIWCLSGLQVYIIDYSICLQEVSSRNYNGKSQLSVTENFLRVFIHTMTVYSKK